MNKVSYFYLLLLLTCFVPHAVNAQTAANGGSLLGTSTPAVSTYTENKVHEGKVNKNKYLKYQKLLVLNSLVNDQKKQIQSMQDKIENSNGLNFAVWTGILLASVAVILTVLGIVMALFSFLGYKKMINSAQDAATKISTEKAPVVTESVLLKLIDQGNFYAVIFSVVQKVTYRGIEFSSGDMLEDNKQEGVE
ncbi:hypothetical protein CS369_18495 [Candidatus Symbiopectobacterium sp. 'North America']|uniref:hypothetical protein n=1 Tax=Candidatus Symbiopectobacterium sp. 'North America' TaxID=2794574 RepID=UPI0018CBCA67|nr:hypothetical protein [Candidatus Symbiopectobacterium sp. 'North America']MBG6246239.1 hypothetical protein [Candidatus Symbiopectobacterium sp. 'North America']